MPVALPTGLGDDLRDSRYVTNWTDYFVARPLAIAGLIVLGLVLRWVLFRVIDRITEQAAEGGVPSVLHRSRSHQMFLESNAAAAERRQLRATTLGALLKSITTGVLLTVVLFMVVAQLGYNIAPLIASAGVIGVALGFGAQSLVKDFLSGIFMLLEDQYGVGDSVDLGQASGTVEAVGLRVTRLRDVNGTVWYVRNGEVLRVGNSTQNWARAVVDVPVTYEQDVSRVRAVLEEIATQLWEDPAYKADILEPPEVWGVERLDPDGVVLRVAVKTTPSGQGDVARQLRTRVKACFDERGIELARPQRVVWQRTAAARPAGSPPRRSRSDHAQ